MEPPAWKDRWNSVLGTFQRQASAIAQWISKRYQRHLGRFHPVIAGAILACLAMAATVFCFLLLALLVYLGAFGPLPTYHDLQTINNSTASQVYDANGVLLGKYYIENRTNADFDEITPAIVNALVATEDARFFEHSGIDFRAVGRVIVKTLLLQKESSGGGSTLSQQLAKNLFPRNSYLLLALPINKFREIIVARRLENTYSKEELIRLYLNTVPFGDDIFGIKVAAQRYFNRPPHLLRIEEVAVLVGLLKANSYYHPVRHPERALTRRNTVLHQMLRYGYLTTAEADSLVQIPMETDYQAEGISKGVATYFREQLRIEVEGLLKDFRKPNGRPYNLNTDGLRVHTTLDARLQQFAEDAVLEQVARLQGEFDQDWGKRNRPWEKTGAFLAQLRATNPYKQLAQQGLTEEQILTELRKPHRMRVFSWANEDREEVRDWSTIDSLRHYLNLLHAGFLAVEPNTGLVRAWVGGIDYRYFQYDHVRSRRQIGSVFKPIVYAQALNAGMLPCEYTESRRVTLTDYDNWSPRNSNGKYEGAYSMQGALAESVNTVSVAVLQRGGIDSTALLAKEMGIGGTVPSVPSMALGTTDASLWEMATVFATLAGEGRRPSLHFLDRIETASGKVIVEISRPDPATFDQVLPAKHAQVITKMLESVVDSGTARRLRYSFKLRGPIAGKTGTTQNQTDGWFIGYTPRLVAGAWVGAESANVHFRTLRKGQGASTALPIWGRFMQKLVRNRQTRRWAQGAFTPPSDTLLAYMACPPYLDELPVLADFWPDYQENPGFFNRWYQESAQAEGSYSLKLKPRRRNETEQEYFQRMQDLNERRLKREERRRKRKDYWSRVLFGDKGKN